MAKSESLKRYILIVNKLSSKQFPSLVELQEFLENHDIYISERTLQRDLESLRDNIGIDIYYDSLEKGYSIRLNQRFPLDNFMRIAQIKIRSDVLMTAIEDLTHNQDFISFEGGDRLKGLDNLEPLLQAIGNRRIITFTYTKFTSFKPKQHKVKPYHLKEFNGRWYLLAMTAKGLTIYALDRLEELKVTTKVFKRDPNIDPKEQYYNQIGVSWGDEDKPALIKLFFNNEQANYVRTLPWHDSQKIIKTNDSGIIVSFYLIVNFELVHQIVSRGENIKVLEPKSLAKEVARIHQIAYSQYIT
jgi:predicted DNA-binding transcriptional regulator YafY